MRSQCLRAPSKWNPLLAQTPSEKLHAGSVRTDLRLLRRLTLPFCRLLLLSLRLSLRLRLWLCSRLSLRSGLSLRLRRWSASFHLRPRLWLPHRLRLRSRHYPRLTLLPLNLHLRPSPWLSLGLRSHRLRIRRMTNHRRLRPWSLRLSHLTLVLNSRRLCLSQLLIINHLLPGSITLGLLLLPQHLSLVLDRRHWLTDTLALGSLTRYAFNSRLLHLLTA